MDDLSASTTGKWRRVPSAPESAIEDLLERSGVALPQQYVALLRVCNGGDGMLDIQPHYLRLWPAETVVDTNLDYQIPELAPGIYGFGDTGGDAFFAFDVRTPSRQRIYTIPFVPMDENEATLIADDFTELLAHLTPFDSR